MNIWVVGTLNQLFILKLNFQKSKVVSGKTPFFVKVHFILPILFALILVFDGAVLYDNITLSIVVLSTKKRYFNFLKKVFVFQKTCFKVKDIHRDNTPENKPQCLQKI